MRPVIPLILGALSLCFAAPLRAAEEAAAAAPESWALHAQATAVVQWHPAFHAAYSGANSLDPKAQGNETTDVTLYAGFRPWENGEFWANPELDQGFGLSDTLGAAGFPSGEAYKVGAHRPYARLPRAFFRQTIDLGGESQTVAPDLNQLAGSQGADRLVLTVGKFGVVDIFDANQYAHDPRNDFLNWSIIDLGSFDYAADAWGFTYGLTAELYKGEWALRAALFDGSTRPNDKALDTIPLDQSQEVVEIERRHGWDGLAGKIKLLGFLTEARLGSYDDARRQAAASGGVPNVALVRRMHGKAGGGINIEQAVSEDAGLFLRAGLTQGNAEAYEFTDINRSLSFGGAMSGAAWGREGDHLGSALAFNGFSEAAKRYFAAGGLGILVGDGRLTSSAGEMVWESYYSLQIVEGLALSADYQLINHPAYNRDRGPVSILAGRAHLQF
jgi:high affinity Mn2+ porin